MEKIEMSETVDKKQAIIEMVRDGAKFETECTGTGYVMWSDKEKCFTYDTGFETDIRYHSIFTRCVEPKKKVKMWQWAVRYPAGVICTNSFHSSEEELKNNFNDNDGYYTIIQRLDHTEIEVEVE